MIMTPWLTEGRGLNVAPSFESYYLFASVCIAMVVVYLVEMLVADIHF